MKASDVETTLTMQTDETGLSCEGKPASRLQLGTALRGRSDRLTCPAATFKCPEGKVRRDMDVPTNGGPDSDATGRPGRADY